MKQYQTYQTSAQELVMPYGLDGFGPSEKWEKIVMNIGVYGSLIGLLTIACCSGQRNRISSPSPSESYTNQTAIVTNSIDGKLTNTNSEMSVEDRGIIK